MKITKCWMEWLAVVALATWSLGDAIPDCRQGEFSNNAFIDESSGNATEDSLCAATFSEWEERVRKQAIWDADRESQGLPSLTKVGDVAIGRSGKSRNARAGGEDAAPRILNVRMVPSGTQGYMYIMYDLDVPSDKKCTVSLRLNNGSVNSSETIPATTLTGDIGQDVNPGRNRCIIWNAGADWPDQYSELVYATVTAEEAIFSSEWVSVRIEWAAYGGRDLDICAYWADAPSQKVGWDWGTSYSDIDWESGDNTGSGPERLRVSSDGVAGRRLRIHFNYYGEAGSPSKARVVATGNGETQSLEARACGSRTSHRAEASDPGVEITFGEFGTPVSIRAIN